MYAKIKLFIYLILVLSSCLFTEAQKTEKEYSEDKKTTIAQLYTRIRCTPAQYGSFTDQRLLPGLIAAHRRIELKSELSGQVLEVNAFEGQYKNKDQLLFRIDDHHLQLEREMAVAELEQSNLDRDERILLLGGEFGVDSSISAKQLKFVHIKAGIPRLESKIRSLDYQISKTRIYAPFDALVANSEIKNYQQINSGEVLATLIDPHSYEIRFEIIENMLGSVSENQNIRFRRTDSQQWHPARIQRINPQVNENAQISIYARPLAGQRDLLDGMHLVVSLDIQSPGKYVLIPIEALLVRSGRDVVFSYDPESGQAKWNYVEVYMKNEAQAAIASGLRPEDLIIFEGNLNLEHNARVLLDSSSIK